MSRAIGASRQPNVSSAMRRKFCTDTQGSSGLMDHHYPIRTRYRLCETSKVFAVTYVIGTSTDELLPLKGI
jgi:hypothetical protein